MSYDQEAEPLALAFLERFWSDRDAGKQIELAYSQLNPPVAHAWVKVA